MFGNKRRFWKSKAKRSTKKVGKATKKYVKKVLADNLENKAIDTTQITQGTNLSGSISAIAHPDQGVGRSAREGQRIRPISLEVQHFACLRGTATREAIGRFVVFQYKRDVNPTVSDILSQSGTSNIVGCPYNYDNRMNYKILYDRTYNIESGNISNVFETTNVMKYTVPKKNLSIINWNTGTLGSSSGFNKLYYIYCDNDVGTNEGTLVSCTLRLIYEDA